jgi:hypothetical protein
LSTLKIMPSTSSSLTLSDYNPEAYVLLHEGFSVYGPLVLERYLPVGGHLTLPQIGSVLILLYPIPYTWGIPAQVAHKLNWLLEDR